MTISNDGSVAAELMSLPQYFTGDVPPRLIDVLAEQLTVDRGAPVTTGTLGDDPVVARAVAARVWDRTPSTSASAQMANQLGMVFSRLDCAPRWRERLPAIEIPTLVVHGRRNLFFPVGNGEAIAREIPGARLLVLDEAATAMPAAAVGKVAEAMLALG